MKKQLLALSLLLILPLTGQAQPLTVWCSGGMMPVLREALPDWQRHSDIQVKLEAAPSMGNTPQSVPQRLAHHQIADVLVMVDDGIAPLVTRGWVNTADKVTLAISWIALAVPGSAAVPDISSAEKLRRVLLRAQSVAYSDSASGIYVSQRLFRRLGIESVMLAKSRLIQASPVGREVASHRVSMGFQQYSELKAVSGLSVVLLPAPLQKATRYSAVIVKARRSPAAREWVHFLQSPRVAQLIREKGMDPQR